MFNQKISKKELITITLLFLCYFLLLLGSRVLNVPDEGRYSEVAREMLLSGDFITPRLDGVAFFHKPVLYYWLQSISYELFGISEWSTRLMPALIGLLGCVVTYVAGALLYSRRAGILAAVILATNPFYYLASHYADMDLEVAVFISSTLLCFIMAIQYPMGGQRRKLMWLAYLFAALGVLTKGLIGIVLPMLVIGAWIAVTWQWRLLREIYLGSGVLIFLVIAMPWFVMVQIRNPGFFDFFIIYQHFSRFTGTGFNNPLPVWFYLPVLLLGLFPWSVPFLYGLAGNIKRLWKRESNGNIDLFLLLWLVLITLFFSLPQSKIVGYILPVVPAMALLAAGYLEQMSDAAGRRRSFLGVALVAMLVGVLMLLFVGKLPPAQTHMGIKPYYLAVALVLLAGAVVTALLAWQRRMSAALASVAVTGSLFTLALLLLFGPVSASNSVKPLAMLLKERIQPGDLVVNYENYYQDLGLYLGAHDRIVVVTDWSDPDIAKKDNWRSEFYRGFSDTDGEERWMVDKSAFAQRLVEGGRVYVFAGSNHADELRNVYHLQLLAEQNNIVLFSNRSDDSAKGPQTAE